MKTKTAWIILTVVLLLAAVKWIYLKPKQPPAQTGGKDAQITRVNAQVVRPEKFSNLIYATGTVIAEEEVMLKPEIQGRLVSVLFEEGSTVKSGTLLAKINDRELQAELNRLTLILKLNKEKEQRLKELFAVNGVSREEYDAAVTQREVTEAEMELVRAKTEQTEIRAPFNGRLGLKLVSQGSIVNAGTIITSIRKTDKVKIDFSLPEKYLADVKLHQLIHFFSPLNMNGIAAKITAIEPGVDTETRNFQVRAVCENASGQLVPGSFVRVEFQAAEIPEALLIPTEAVIPELKGKKVFLYRSGKALPVKIKTGIRNDTRIEVLEGLQNGDTLITSGIMSLKPEAAISIQTLK